MKKFLVVVSMLTMLFAFNLTANASAVSPSGTPYEPEAETPEPFVVPEGVLGARVAPQQTAGVLGVRSPKTGDDQMVLYIWGTAAVVLAAGAAAVAKKSKEA